MVAEKLGDGRIARLVFLFELFEKHRHLVRVVSGVIHQVRPNHVGLRLGGPGILKEI